MSGQPIGKLRNGTLYYATFDDARTILNVVSRHYPEARIVRYTLGFAVQYYKSGPYFG